MRKETCMRRFLLFDPASQVLNLFRSQGVQKCTTLKNILATLTVIVEDLFSVGNQRLQLFETVSKILSGTFTASEMYSCSC